jgi:pimeloyl-ACP methyl ester carboxylesterase
MPLPTRFAEIDGRRLRFARLGAGTPVVLLHGYPDNLQLWSLVAPLVAEDFDVIALDWPGMGLSEAWPGGASPFHMANHLMALLDHLNIARAAIVGADMGGQPALIAAARHPDRVSHVVVTGSLLQWDAPTSWEIGWLRRFRVNQLAIGMLPRIVFARALRTFLPPTTSLEREVREDFWRCFRDPAVRRFIVRMCAGYQGTLPRLPQEYARISAPLLALWGERDQHFPPVHAVRLGEHVRHAVVKIIPGGEHWLPLQLPIQFAHEVRTFLRQ